MKLIVGLGNPGKEYEKTRHNCGFMAIDFFARNNNLDFKEKFNGLYSEININNEKIILLKPTTFMNLSGECVLKFVNYYNIDYKDILIIYDDKDYELGAFKIKRKGSSAGHNGLNSILNLLHTEDINRVKIGISKNNLPLKDYVLKKFTKSEQEKIDNLLPTISNIMNDFSNLTIDELMEKYNGKNNEK